MADRGGPPEFPDPPTTSEQWRQLNDSRIVAGIPSRGEGTQVDDKTYISRFVVEMDWDLGLGRCPDNPHQPQVTSERLVSYADAHLGGTPWMRVPNETYHACVIGRSLSLPPDNTQGENISKIYSGTYPGVPSVDRTLEIWTAEQRCILRVGGYIRGSDEYRYWRSDLEELGLKTGRVGVKVTVSYLGADVIVEYFERFPSNLRDYPMIDAHLQAELRLATALAWTHPFTAASICAYVVAWTANNAEYTPLNCRAAALGQQLSTLIMMQNNVTYVPELKVEEYTTATSERIEVVEEFNRQFERFTDKEATLEDQMAAWDVMLDKAKGERDAMAQRRDRALERYDSASEVANNCRSQFEADDQVLKDAKAAFDEGVRQWKEEQMRNIFFALFDFVLGVGELCLGDIGGMGTVLDAVQTLGSVEDGAGKLLSGDTLQKLGSCMQSIATLLAGLEALVEAAKGYLDGSTSLPSTDSISGSGTGDADSTTIFALGEWDKWSMESDQQMEFAVREEIEGASEYRLALRKHAVNGKTLAQALANTINLGQEYVQLQMELAVLDKDVDKLQQLQEGYQQESEVYQEAMQKFYDRETTLKVGVWMDMKKAAAAYRYYSLREFDLPLGPLVPVEELMDQLQHITSAIREADENWDKDFQTFEYHSSSEQFPSTVDHRALIQGLKDSTTRKAKFTLAPTTAAGGAQTKINSQGLPADFHDGFHWRVWGMDPVLRGAVPRPEKLVNGHVVVNLWITTEGMFSDIDEKSDVHYFSARPQSKLCAYELYESGEVHITTSAIARAERHMDRTPFTQWTIEIERESYEALNLDALEGLDMHWMGKYMPIKPPSRKPPSLNPPRRDSGLAL